MNHMHLFSCLKKCHEKYKITTENQGEKFVITLSGKKDDIATLEKKLNALNILVDGCCEEGSIC